MEKFYDTFTEEGREDYKKKWQDYHKKLDVYKDWVANRKNRQTVSNCLYCKNVCVCLDTVYVVIFKDHRWKIFAIYFWSLLVAFI